MRAAVFKKEFARMDKPTVTETKDCGFCGRVREILMRPIKALRPAELREAKINAGGPPIDREKRREP